MTGLNDMQVTIRESGRAWNAAITVACPCGAYSTTISPAGVTTLGIFLAGARHHLAEEHDHSYSEGMNLSEKAKSALMQIQPRRGAIMPRQDEATTRELEQAGLVGVQHGITEKGLARRAAIFNAALDEAF